MILPDFGLAAEVLLFRQKGPKPVTPRPNSLMWDERMAQEGGLTRSAQTKSAVYGSVRPKDRTTGVGQRGVGT